MKYVLYSVVCLLGLLTNYTVFGYVAKDKSSPEIVYCPGTVECSGNTVQTCHPSNEEKPYFEEIKGNSFSVKGISNFIAAYSIDSSVGEACCRYSKNSYSFYLCYKREFNLVAYKNKTSKWDNYTSPSHCQSSDPLQCPLQIKPELVIVRTLDEQPLSVKIKANGILVKYVLIKRITYSKYLTVNYDEAFSACQGDKLCRLDISYSFSGDENNHPLYFNAGYLIIDMQNNFHILKINTGKNKGSDGDYTLEQIEPFNAVKFVKLNVSS